MAEKFYSLLTNIGKAKIANSVGLGTKINFVTMKVGDGGGAYYDPTEDQTDLKNIVWSGNINHVEIDAENPNWINIEVMIPSTVGGFTIREYGAFDEDGNMIGICKTAESYKPVIADGSTKELLLTLVLAVSNTESVTLKIDPTIIFAKKSEVEQLRTDVNAAISGINTQLSESVNILAPITGSTANAILLNIATLANNKKYSFKATAASTGNVTINGKAFKKLDGTQIGSGGVKANKVYDFYYDSTADCVFILAKAVGTATVATVLAPYTFSNGDDIELTGTIPIKTAATYNPSTAAQIIAAGQYINGSQTIAAVIGTATDPDVVAGKTYNSDAGIMRTGTASIESLGGKKFATGTVTSSSGTINVTAVNNAAFIRATISVTGLNFVPKRIKVRYYDSANNTIDCVDYEDISFSANLTGTLNTTFITASSIGGYCIKQDANVKVASNGFVLPVQSTSKSYTWEASA